MYSYGPEVRTIIESLNNGCNVDSLFKGSNTVTDKLCDTFLVSYLNLLFPESMTAKKCNTDVFNDTMCDGGTRVLVVRASLGDKYRDSNATLSIDHCRINYLPEITTPACLTEVRDVNQTYQDEIERKCNGQEKCNGLTALQHHVTWCNNHDYTSWSQYVQLEYVCLLNYGTYKIVPRD